MSKVTLYTHTTHTHTQTHTWNKQICYGLRFSLINVIFFCFYFLILQRNVNNWKQRSKCARIAPSARSTRSVRLSITCANVNPASITRAYARTRRRRSMSMSMSTSIRFPPCPLLCPRSRAARCKLGMENRLDSLYTVSAVKQQERRDRQRQVAGEFDAKTNHSDNNNNNSNSAMPYIYIYIYLDKDKKKTKTKW